MERLRDLAYDLWWSWSPPATRLFTWIDPDHWRRYHNPVQLLINVERHHWDRLLADPEFRRAYDAVIHALDAYRARERWFDQSGHKLRRPHRLLLDGVRHPRVAGRVLRRPGHPRRRPLQGGQRPRRAAGRGRPPLPLGLLPADRRRRRLPAAHLSRLRLRPPARAARGVARRRRAHRARRPARARGAGRGVEGAGRPRAGADARHRHPAQRSRRPSHHRPCSTCAGARCGCARRSCSASAACARCAPWTSGRRSAT